MSHLTKLKLTDKTRTAVEVNPEDLLRSKLIDWRHRQTVRWVDQTLTCFMGKLELT